MKKLANLVLSLFIFFFGFYVFIDPAAAAKPWKVQEGYAGAKSCVQADNGTFQTKEDCEAELKKGMYKYISSQYGASCQPNVNGDLTYSQCQDKLPKKPWKVQEGYAGAKSCVQADNGTFQTKEDCEAELKKGMYKYISSQYGASCQPNKDGKLTYAECQYLLETGQSQSPGEKGQNPCPNGVCKTALGDIPTNPQAFGTKILSIAVGLGGGFAFILMVIGSIRVLTSSGDAQKLSGGRDMIVAAIAGLLFIIFSVLILQFVGVEIIGLNTSSGLSPGQGAGGGTGGGGGGSW